MRPGSSPRLLGWFYVGRRQRQGEFIDASLHVDTDAICPDCLRWIAPDDYVRRNAFDLLEHEVCPPESLRVRLG